jgi:hypothetical protein
MSEEQNWKRRCADWRDGTGSDQTALAATADYLSATADWIAVRDFLLSMAMSERQILNWFAEQDFPDFAEAVEQGWGWPEDFGEDA